MQPGRYKVTIQPKPSSETLRNLIRSVMNDDVQSILFSMPAALATEFRVVQLLAILHKQGKEVSIEWNDQAPTGPVHQIISAITK